VDARTETVMIYKMMHLLFGCRHKRVTRPITPVNRAKDTARTYVSCLDCGKQFLYDVSIMRMGAEISGSPAAGADSHFQTSA
jgi:hypothetical protein